MSVRTFSQYKLLREAGEISSLQSGPNAVGSRISLGDGNKFPAFEVSDDPKSENYGKNKNLAPVIRAFKQGANWGWSRDDQTGGDKPVKINSKKIYLAGGTVRDHLLGKKPRHVELATSASPDEVYRILKQNGFTYVDKKGGLNDHSKNSPNQKEGSNQYFWVEQTNKNDRPFIFGIGVNDDTFKLEVFRKTPRGLSGGDDIEPGTQTEDAAGRDFTINGMYILLSNDNGPNKDLYDFFGGMHHIVSGKIHAIGDMETKLEEDPSRILRYIRMLTSYGNPDKVSDDERMMVKKLANKVGGLDRKFVMDEFKKGMDKDDVDPRNYLKCCRDFGVLDHIFPGKLIDPTLPKEMSELGDRHMPLAFMLRMNSPSSLEDLGMDPRDLQKISFLIKTLGLNDNIDANGLADLTTGYLGSGISSRKLRDFGTKLGGLDGGLMDAFVNYTKQPRVKIFVTKDGENQISDDFADIFDTFSDEIDPEAADERKRQLELNSFHNQLKFMRPN